MKILNSSAIRLYTISQFEFLIDEAIINDKNMNFMRIGWRYIDVVETFSDHLRRSLPLRNLCVIQRKFSATESDLGIFTVLVEITRAPNESNPNPRNGREKEKREFVCAFAWLRFRSCSTALRKTSATAYEPLESDRKTESA
ncbi:hypothetical protein CsSME_00050189 [Camellia sinensis var. sinensis]